MAAELDIQVFGGTAPKMHATKLPDHFAQTAENCDVQAGSLKSLNLPSSVSVLGASTYEVLWKRGSTWTPMTTDSFVVDSFVDDDKNRFYWTDPLTYPKKSDDDEYPSSFRLGIPAPTVVLTMSSLGTPGSEVQDTVSYVYTQVSEWGEESAPSPATAVIEVMEGAGIQLSGFASPAGTDNGTITYRIYRLSTGSLTGDYLFLADHTSGTYDDYSGTGLDDLEADVLPTLGWTAPPDDLTGLIECHNGMMAGYAGKTLYLSEPYIPYAYPEDYTIEFKKPITGLGSYGEVIIVITEEKPYAVIGHTPESAYAKPIEFFQSCVSERSPLGTPFGVFYASPDGLCQCTSTEVKVISDPYITKAQWAAMAPETLKLTLYEGTLYGFFLGTTDVISYDIETGELRTIDLDDGTIDEIKDIYHDGSTDTIYLLAGRVATTDCIYALEGGSGLLGYTWKSKQFHIPIGLAAAKVEGDFASGTVSFKWYLDGVLVMTKTVSSDSVFRLPAKGYHPLKSLQIEGDIRIDRIRAAAVPKELA